MSSRYSPLQHVDKDLKGSAQFVISIKKGGKKHNSYKLLNLILMLSLLLACILLKCHEVDMKYVILFALVVTKL